MMGLRGESMNPMTFGNMTHPRPDVVVGKNKWFFERTIFCCEKILDLINSYFGSLVTLEKGT